MAIDWEDVERDIAPPDLSPETWEPLFAELRAQVGETWADYLDALRQNAVRRADLGQPTYDVGRLFLY